MRLAKRLVGVVLGLAASSPVLAQVKRGEVNGDGVLDLSDSIASLAYLFLGGRAPVCLDAADANGDGVLDISDPVLTLSFLFLGGPRPAGPVPDCQPACGAPPHEAPVYSRHPDDSIAFASLLEGSGYGRSNNSDWTDIASGDFCSGSEKELVLLKNMSSFFSILGGPTPFPVGAFDLESSAAHPWRAVAAGNLDADRFDEIVAVRRVTAPIVPDVLVIKVDPSACDAAQVVASATIGGVGGSDWVDAAVGRFDGSGQQVAVLRTTRPFLHLLERSGPTLRSIVSTDLSNDPAYPVQGLAAGDLDGDGIDELVVAHQVDDGRGATVVAYQRNALSFTVKASATYGNTGNSAWSGIAAGDFNGDGRAAIALLKDRHSAFSLLDLPPGRATLRELAAADLESAPGQEWRGVTAIDWLGGDRGAAELIAVRAAQDPYRADLFVHGDPFHRAQRDSALEDIRGGWDQQRDVAPAVQLGWLHDSHTNTIGWQMWAPEDYPGLVAFLQATQNVCVDGRQLRVFVTVYPGRDEGLGNCSPQPTDSQLSPWKRGDFFSPPSAVPLAHCRDFIGWAKLIGRLAQEYPHLIWFGVDDGLRYPADLTGEIVAEIQSHLRRQAPWLSFVPVAYHATVTSNPPDMGRTLDSILYFFRNEQNGQCLGGSCGERSVDNAPLEIANALAFLPEGRQLQVGTYWGTLDEGVAGLDFGTGRYNYDLGRLIRNLGWPGIGGVFAYPVQKRSNGLVCDDFNALDSIGFDQFKFCALVKVHGAKPQPVRHRDLTGESGALGAAGDPFAYVFPAHNVENVVYRAVDGHVHELWRSGGSIGHTNLSQSAGAPGILGDPMAYIVPAQDLQNLIYLGTDNHVHGLYWSRGAVDHDALSALAGAPRAAGVPYGYFFNAIGYHNVVYRTSDGHLHVLYWSTGAVGHDDLSTLAPAPTAMGDPFGYVFDAIGYQHVLYGGSGGGVHALYWSTGAVGHEDLSALAGAPGPAERARVTAYIASTLGLQYAVYRGADGHLHGLYWSTGAVGHDDLTRDTHAPEPVGDPTGYFAPSDGSHHVVYRSGDGHIRHLAWTVGVVSHDNLTLLADAPLAVGDPAAYLAADGRTHHVIYRSVDGRLHDLSFGN